MFTSWEGSKDMEEGYMETCRTYNKDGKLYMMPTSANFIMLKTISFSKIIMRGIMNSEIFMELLYGGKANYQSQSHDSTRGCTVILDGHSMFQLI